tara:strand:+ start:4733 stop:5716 length:984 start_codon:yes stop_codon:yes gene_type:complete
MAKTFRIDIQEPIWKTKSVGVNLSQCNPDDIVEVHVLYTTKDGRRTFPFTYLMKASICHTYPIRYKGNGTVPLHDIPIADFNIKEENNLNFQQAENVISNQSNKSKNSTMLFDGNDIKKMSEENKSKSGDNRPKIPSGVNSLTVVGITTVIDAKGIPKLVLEYKKDDGHRTSKESLKLSGEYSEIDRSKLIDWFERAFGYLIQPCNSSEDLVRQLKQFEGKQFQGAIQHQKSLYTAKETGEVMIVRYVRLWYVGSITDKSFAMDIKKAVKELSAKDMDRVVQLKDLGTIVRDVDEEKEEKAEQSQADPRASLSSFTDLSENNDDPFA